MQPGFNVYWENIEVGMPTLHIELGHKHEGGEDHAVVLGFRDAKILNEFLKADISVTDTEKLFSLWPFNDWQKDLEIAGPDGLTILVDYDDVDHEQVAKQAQQLVDVLNKYWKVETHGG